ncbi:MAG: hypothetical protein IT230_08705 [Flavobacteriales bacterium]|nr:hypothetical protein [Flavobacteriales bacterium]
MWRAAPLVHDGTLTEAAMELLHAVSGVDKALLRAARIRPSRSNWLHAPWYGRRRGGALTMGRTIWFTANWFDPKGLGSGSLKATYAWLLHLAHEVGHLPQAERFGQHLPGKARYTAAFVWQYAVRALLLQPHVHDGSPLEREADIGRQVLRDLVALDHERHPVVQAVHSGHAEHVRQWCAAHSVHLAELSVKHAARPAGPPDANA